MIMRAMLLTMTIAVAPGSGDFDDPWAPGVGCGEQRAQAEHYATALQRVADCVNDNDPVEAELCVEQVLSESE